MSWLTVRCYVGVLLLQLIGCAIAASGDLQVSQVAPSKDGALAIVSIDPPTSDKLSLNQRVVIAIEVDYTAAVSNATLEFLVQDAANAVLVRQEQAVPPGKWRRALKAEITVPDTSNINIAVLLHAKGQGFLGGDGRTYRVTR